MKSWKTSSLGILSIIIGIGAAVNLYLDGNPATMPDWAILGTTILNGLGLIFAGDASSSGGST